jgi:hypothetical protein
LLVEAVSVQLAVDACGLGAGIGGSRGAEEAERRFLEGLDAVVVVLRRGSW